MKKRTYKTDKGGTNQCLMLLCSGDFRLRSGGLGAIPGEKYTREGG